MSKVGNEFSTKRLKATGAYATALTLVAALCMGIAPSVASTKQGTSGISSAVAESAVSDVSGPVLRNYSVSPLNHNLSDGPAEITIRATITDATGTQAPTLSVSHDSGQSYGFGSMTLVSGSAKDGTWERKVTIPQGAASGAWEVSLFPLNDVMGNSGNGFRTLGIVNIESSVSDVSAPVLRNYSVSPLNHNLSDGPAEITIRATITDATGTQAPTLSVSHDSGQSYGFGSMTLVSGSAKDGTWERKVTIPQGAASGAWEVSLFPLNDVMGNSGNGFRTLGIVNILDQVELKELGAPVPEISGIAKIGSTLSVSAGTWAPSGAALKYQWERNGVSIEGATKPTYTLAITDAGQKITVTVTGSKSGYKSVSKTSAATAIPLMSLTGTPVPKVSGTAKVGSTLKANAGTWKPATVTLKYQWKRDGKTITGATKTSYKLVAADAGKKITVTITGSKSGYKSVSKTSAATAIPLMSLTGTPVPKVSGTAKVGSTLKANAGTWKPATVTLKYQWKRDGKTITGATKTSYKLAKSDKGRKVTVTTTGSKSGYKSVSKTSLAKLIK